MDYILGYEDYLLNTSDILHAKRIQPHDSIHKHSTPLLFKKIFTLSYLDASRAILYLSW